MRSPPSEGGAAITASGRGQGSDGLDALICLAVSCAARGDAWWVRPPVEWVPPASDATRQRLFVCHVPQSCSFPRHPAHHCCGRTPPSSSCLLIGRPNLGLVVKPAGVAERLHNKTFLITGATGFIAKRSGEILMLCVFEESSDWILMLCWVMRCSPCREAPAAAASGEDAVPPGARRRPGFCNGARPLRGRLLLCAALCEYFIRSFLS